MVTMRLTAQQSARIAELPDEYRVVGVDRSTPLVRKPAGKLLRIQPNGRLVAATIAARRGLARRDGEPARDHAEEGVAEVAELKRLRRGPAFATPYTAELD
jgi:hypothetical protein